MRSLVRPRDLLAEEVDLLSSCLPEQRFQLEVLADDVAGLLVRKRSLALESRAAFWRSRDPAYSESTRHDDRSTLVHAGLTMSYGYQRFDLRVDRENDFAAHAYGEVPNGFSSHGFYGSSGMAVIASLLNAIRRSPGLRSEVPFPRDAYFETLLLQEQLLRTVNPDPRLRNVDSEPLPWVYIDSIAVLDPTRDLPRGPERLAFAAVDTTCWRSESAPFRRLLSWSRETTTPLVLLRSHLKLDVLGTDLGRLGSLVALFPAGLDRERARGVLALVEEARSWMARTGGAFRVEDVPAHFGTCRSTLLSNARTRFLQAATLLLRETLELDPGPCGDITIPHHGVFALVDVPTHMAGRYEAPPAHAVAAHLRALGLEASVCAGFGFDAMVVDGYIDGATGRDVVRIAPGVHTFPSSALSLSAESVS